MTGENQLYTLEPLTAANKAINAKKKIQNFEEKKGKTDISAPSPRTQTFPYTKNVEHLD